MVEGNVSSCKVKSYSGCHFDNVESTVLSEIHPVAQGKSYRFHLYEVPEIVQDLSLEHARGFLEDMGKRKVGD